ncbi:hypothetical protein I5M27_08125 [Adhaeribacter sp. BT258]|uniref:Uncharacterized protein n=1 Tax=Adhaeribacter terrigena TaxID=2793070 RepID=A0ABS1C1A4_9BACT|nr:hypothetical protein [Adhaeribacter terrigena]MBK0402951.1 hypothetical protein [Adhaeribacter terrigena]
MNKASFLTLVRQASRISDQDVEELEKLVVNFPYCQTAHLLIAKAAYDKGSMLSNQKLKKAAIYAANRQLLKKLIYTSDATVSLNPLETAETAAETTDKVTSAAEKQPAAPALPELEPEILEETETHEVDLDADITNAETPAESAENEALTAAKSQEVPKATLSETEQEEAAGERLVAETNAILTQANESIPELTVAEALYEDAAIAEDILEEGRLPETEAEFLGALAKEEETLPFSIPAPIEPDSEPETEKTVGLEAGKLPETTIPMAENPEAETLPEPVATVFENVLSDTETEGLTEEKVAEEESPADEVTALSEKNSTEAHAAPEEETAETETSTEVTAQELVAAAAHTLEDVPDLHELFLENAPEAVAETPVPETEQASVLTEPVTILNDDLLHETLANFDQYLFKPEKEQATEEIARPEEDLKVVYPKDEIQHIYDNDALGYWMNTSRLGESLQLKNELTTPQPYDFYPDLIWEYSKTHELRKEIKPTVSKLSKQLEIIDEFLKLTPRLKSMAHNKVKPETQEDLSSKSSKITKNLASENFANILVQQGKIKKAIKIYEHLILKIPEKKAYFVTQIEKLQNQE